MAWIVRLVKVGVEGETRSSDVMAFERPDGLRTMADLGLTLAEAKQLLAAVQQQVVAEQAADHSAHLPTCPECGSCCRVKDYRPRAVATLFGQVMIRLPRFRCVACCKIETGIRWPAHCRSTPELQQLQAHLSALMTYRTAADLLVQMFPIDAGKDPETLRRRVLKAGAALEAQAAPAIAAPAATISVTLDGTFVRSCEPGERHLEVRVGNVETSTGARQVFAAVAGADTDIAALIRGNLTAVGRAADTTLTAFTDGCPGLRNILADAGIRTAPMLDWFHIAMRLNHLKQIADAISTTNAEQEKAKAAIVDEVERLRWRLWNGKATNARVSIDRIHAVMCRFRGEHGRKNHAASAGKLWAALHALDKYLVGQNEWLVNYAARHRAGLRVGTSITEGTANFLVNRRMNKRQQMRWSRRGADLLLQVRCAVYNGAFGSTCGRRFYPANDTTPLTAKAG